MSSLHTCFKSLKEINDFLSKFLWDGKRDKIKQSETIADYGNGGQHISRSIREYARQLKYNLELEKQISIVTDY